MLIIQSTWLLQSTKVVFGTSTIGQKKIMTKGAKNIAYLEANTY